MCRLAMARCNTTRTRTSDCESLCLQLTGQHYPTRNNRKDRAAKGSFKFFSIGSQAVPMCFCRFEVGAAVIAACMARNFSCGVCRNRRVHNCLLFCPDCFSMQVFKETQRFSSFNGPTPTTGSAPPDGKPVRETNGEVGGRPWRPR